MLNEDARMVLYLNLYGRPKRGKWETVIGLRYRRVRPAHRTYETPEPGQAWLGKGGVQSGRIQHFTVTSRSTIIPTTGVAWQSMRLVAILGSSCGAWDAPYANFVRCAPGELAPASAEGV